jgi:superfamily II DNA or RNA helicase
MLFTEEIPQTKTDTTKTLRDYQIASKARVFAEFQHVQSTLIVLPTGCGKTVVLSKIANEWETGNVLILAHRIELLDQAADKLYSELGYRPPIEQGERGIDADTLWQGGNIIVGSVQTMRNMKRLEKFSRCPFGLIIIDEAHHATASSYRQILDNCLEWNPQCKVLGVTATPKRSDDAALGIVFDSLAYSMELQHAIEEGWLVDIQQEYVVVDGVDWSGIGSSKNELGEADFNRGELEAILTQEEALHSMATPILDTTNKGEQALIFTAGVAHAHQLAAVLNRHREGCAFAVDGTTPKDQRAEIVQKFHAGEVQYLANFGVFTEGFDCPNVSRVIMGRPTKSPSLYIQMLGRGTRPLAGVVDGIDSADARRFAISLSAKPHMIVLDFVGNSRHKAVSAVDALGGNYDVETKQLAEQRVKERGGDVLDELKKAKAEIALLREEKRRQRIRGKATYSRTSGSRARWCQ